jgi:hypothetical protein
MTADGVLVFNSHHRDVPDDVVPRFHKGRNAFRCTIPPGLLNAGRFIVHLRVSLHNIRWIAYEDSVLTFDVIADHGQSPFVNAQPRAGIIFPILDWEAVEPVADESRRPAAIAAS